MQEVQASGSVEPPVMPGARIDMHRDTDIAFWCRVFDVNPAELRRAVQQVGPQVAAVRRQLEKTHAHAAGWVHDSGF